MKWFMTKAIDFIKKECGVTAIEYGLIAMLISIMIIAGLTVAKPGIERMYNDIGSAIENANSV